MRLTRQGMVTVDILISAFLFFVGTLVLLILMGLDRGPGGSFLRDLVLFPGLALAFGAGVMAVYHRIEEWRRESRVIGEDVKPPARVATRRRRR